MDGCGWLREGKINHRYSQRVFGPLPPAPCEATVTREDALYDHEAVRISKEASKRASNENDRGGRGVRWGGVNRGPGTVFWTACLKRVKAESEIPTARFHRSKITASRRYAAPHITYRGGGDI